MKNTYDAIDLLAGKLTDSKEELEQAQESAMIHIYDTCTNNPKLLEKVRDGVVVRKTEDQCEDDMLIALHKALSLYVKSLKERL